MVEPRFDLAITRVTPRQFQRQIEMALATGLTLLPLREYLAQPPPRLNFAAITFDDAYQSIHEHAFPLLQRLGLRATLFAPSAWLGKMDDWDVNFFNLRFAHMSAEQVREIAGAGWEIGSHAATHRDLTRLNDAELEDEVTTSRQFLQQLTATPVTSISYPFGNTDARVVTACKQAGYQHGCVMGRVHAQLEAGFCIPRFGVYLYDFPGLFMKKSVAKYQKMFKLLQQGIDFCSDGTVLVKQGGKKPIKSA